MPKRQSYSTTILKRKQDQRHFEATERNHKWNLLTPQQQLDSLAARGHRAERQVARIKAKMVNTKRTVKTA